MFVFVVSVPNLAADRCRLDTNLLDQSREERARSEGGRWTQACLLDSVPVGFLLSFSSVPQRCTEVHTTYLQVLRNGLSSKFLSPQRSPDNVHLRVHLCGGPTYAINAIGADTQNDTTPSRRERRRGAELSKGRRSAPDRARRARSDRPAPTPNPPAKRPEELAKMIADFCFKVETNNT